MPNNGAKGRGMVLHGTICQHESGHLVIDDGGTLGGVSTGEVSLTYTYFDNVEDAKIMEIFTQVCIVKETVCGHILYRAFPVKNLRAQLIGSGYMFGGNWLEVSSLGLTNDDGSIVDVIRIMDRKEN